MKWVNELKAERDSLSLSLILIPDWQIGSRVSGLIVDGDGDERPSSPSPSPFLYPHPSSLRSISNWGHSKWFFLGPEIKAFRRVEKVFSSSLNGTI